MMKKILIIGTIASSMAFAKGFNNKVLVQKCFLCNLRLD